MKYLDVSAWPVVVYQTPPTIDDDELKAILAESQMLLRLRRAHATVLDASQTEHMTPTQRRILTDQMRADAELTRVHCRAVGLVITSRFVRGLLTAIWWVHPPIVPSRVFATRTDAVAWCKSMVSAAQPSGGDVAAPP